MCNSYLKIKKYCVLVLVVCCILSASPAVAQFYFNDFEGIVGPEWSNNSTDITPAGARTFLGQFYNQTVSLTLASVPAGDVTVSFDVFIINSWDGNGDHGNGPDIFDVSVSGGPTILHTTFCNVDPWSAQAYPDAYPGGVNPSRSGAVEINSLGFVGWGDSVYHLSHTFEHSGGALVLNFSATGLYGGILDESWGLDNVLVNILQDVNIDIKPSSCPNPLNVKDKGVLPVAILGSEDFDVFNIDPASIRLEGVAPIRSSYEDVSTPVPDGAEISECTTGGPDGYLDLTLKFKVQEIFAALVEVNDGEELELTLTGVLNNGTLIEGKDCILIISKGKPE